MNGQDPLNTWRDEFQQQVDEVIAESSALAATPDSRQVPNWWKSPESPKPGPPTLVGQTDFSDQEKVASELRGRLEHLVEQKAELEDKVSRLTHENDRLRERQSQIQTEIAALEAKMSRSRESYESHINGLKMQTRQLEEQVKNLREDKAFLEQAFARMESEGKRLHEELRSECEKTAFSQAALTEVKRELAEQIARAQKLEQEVAEKNGSVEELRRQASVYQERLAQAKESTDADIGAIRQDIRMFLEELKTIRGAMRPPD